MHLDKKITRIGLFDSGIGIIYFFYIFKGNPMNTFKKTLLFSVLFLLSCATQTIVASGEPVQPVQPANTSTAAAATTSSSEPVKSPRSFMRHFTEGPRDE